MRLLNTSSMKFSTFEGTHIPKYAILSHRWGSLEEETSYERFELDTEFETPGRRKVEQFCHVAKQDSHEWAWVDTCCIDKRSSAELTEAINSMFHWYRNAEICYAYLNDVAPGGKCVESIWWSRGWTLQELIAPPEVIFLDQNWNKAGTKTDLSFIISFHTTIPGEVLRQGNSKKYMHYSIAQRMSWAARRRTTREEDMAYSLLGLFHINMPLLYGEGANAFQRLQLEIIQKYSDESIFAWGPQNFYGPPYYAISDFLQTSQNVLARSPDDFLSTFHQFLGAREGNVLEGDGLDNHPPRVTSWGIELVTEARKLTPLSRLHIDGRTHDFIYAVRLTAYWNLAVRELPYTLLLVRSGPRRYNYRRWRCIHHTANFMQRLKVAFDVGRLEPGEVFYLLFDEDSQYGIVS